MKIMTIAELLEDNSLLGACAREFLEGKELAGLEVGKYPLSEGCKVSVLEYDTKEVPKYEAHKVFVDVQLLAVGEEEMRVAPLANGKEKTPYDEVKDVCFYDIDCEPEVLLVKAGQAAIFYPEDVHAPNLGAPVSHNKKLVFKVPVAKL